MSTKQQDDQDDLLINLRDKGPIDLQALVEWAGEVQGFQLLLENDEFAKVENKVVFLSKVEVNRETFMLLVQEVLKANGFTLVEGPVEGWKRVLPLKEAVPFAPLIQQGDAARPEFDYVSAIFQLKHIGTEDASAYLNLFSPENASSIRSVQRGRLIIATDLARNIRKIESLLAQVDVPQQQSGIRFYRAIHLEAEELETQLNLILSDSLEGDRSQQASGPEAANNSLALGLGQPSGRRPKIVTDQRTNRLILIGANESLDQILKLVEQLDVPLETELKTYQFRHISAKRIDDLLQQSFSGVSAESRSRIYRSTVDSQTNQLIVTARKDIHLQIESLARQLDTPTEARSRSPMKFYTLKNVRVADIVDTLQSIERRVRGGAGARTPLSGINTNQGLRPFNPEGALNQPGTNLSPGAGFFDSVSGGSGPGMGQSGFPDNPGLGLAGRNARDSGIGQMESEPAFDEATGFSAEKVIPGEARITTDENTNTLIVVAEPEVQQLYAELIQRLDKRRPQVMIEAHVVVIEGRESLNIGVEVGGGDRTGTKKLFAFSSFGLSDVDPITGALKIKPSIGFNGTLIDPDTADVVLQALAENSRSRVVSSPKIVVDDNESGLLSSVAEVPFSSINANNTISTTSFAGFAQAGTTINVTPHISEDDYLNLEFDILVNNFTGTGANGLPPPRNTDQVTSVVTIPDGYTVIVGGLNRRRIAEETKGLPGLERFPLLRLLSSLESQQSSDAMMFVFLKPIILRDDQFRDLLYLSDTDQNKACLPGNYPESEPVLIR